MPEILPRLLSRLLDPESTKSVQNAIVKVMPPLMKMNKDQANETLEHLLATALAKNTHSVTRRGAAMGLGATVKGLSIQAHGVPNFHRLCVVWSAWWACGVEWCRSEGLTALVVVMGREGGAERKRRSGTMRDGGKTIKGDQSNGGKHKTTSVQTAVPRLG